MARRRITFVERLEFIRAVVAEHRETLRRLEALTAAGRDTPKTLKP